MSEVHVEARFTRNQQTRQLFHCTWKMGKKVEYWIHVLYPIVAFSTIVYTIILILNWVYFYDMDKNHPIIIFAYISLIHFLSIPILFYATKGHHKFFLYFVWINTIWIILVIIALVSIYVNIRK